MSSSSPRSVMLAPYTLAPALIVSVPMPSSPAPAAVRSAPRVRRAAAAVDRLIRGHDQVARRLQGHAAGRAGDSAVDRQWGVCAAGRQADAAAVRGEGCTAGNRDAPGRRCAQASRAKRRAAVERDRPCRGIAERDGEVVRVGAGPAVVESDVFPRCGIRDVDPAGEGGLAGARDRQDARPVAHHVGVIRAAPGVAGQRERVARSVGDDGRVHVRHVHAEVQQRPGFGEGGRRQAVFQLLQTLQGFTPLLPPRRAIPGPGLRCIPGPLLPAKREHDESSATPGTGKDFALRGKEHYPGAHAKRPGGMPGR